MLAKAVKSDKNNLKEGTKKVLQPMVTQPSSFQGNSLKKKRTPPPPFGKTSENYSQARKMNKIPKNSTQPEKKSKMRNKKYEYVGEYEQVFTGLRISVSKSSIKFLIERMGAWLEDIEKNGLKKMSSYTMEEFLWEQKIPSRSYYEWLKKFEELQAAHDEALEKLGMLREAGSLHRKLDLTHMKTNQAQYSWVWRKCRELEAQLKKVEESQTQTINVILPEIPTSDKVPPLGDK